MKQVRNKIISELAFRVRLILGSILMIAQIK